MRNKDGHELVLGKSGQIAIVDDKGVEREKYTLPNGAHLHVHEDQEVSQKTLLADWDPFNEPIIAEENGRVRYLDIVEGKTMQEKEDEIAQARHILQEHMQTIPSSSMFLPHLK